MSKDEVIKTIGIKLKTTEQQEDELRKLFEAFRLGINWSLTAIEKRYQAFLKNYTELPSDMQVVAICSACHEEKDLRYKDKVGGYVCATCAKKSFSEYTVRKEIYGVGDRKVESDLKDVVEIQVKTHYTWIFSQAYSMWKSYDGWRNKRLGEKERLEDELRVRYDRSKKLYVKFEPTGLESETHLDAAINIETLAKNIKLRNTKLTWRLAKAQAVKSIYQIFRDETDQKKINRLHDKLIELRRLSRPVNFPQLTECRTVMMNSGFVAWEEGKLYLTLWTKGMKEVEYFGKNYLAGYLFNWDSVPGTDSENLVNYLIRDFKIGWVKTAIIEKTDDGKAIKLTSGENALLLKLNDEKTKANLTIGDGRTKELIASAENGKLSIYHGKYISLMEQDRVYCNLTKKNGHYYLMYPLAIKVKHPPDIKECDTFVFMTSPKKTAMFGYDRDGALNSVKWFDTGRLVFAKRNFKEKRAEIGNRRSDDEKMRSIRRRKKKIRKRGSVEMRYVSTFNHQLTRKMIDYLMEQSENPKLLIWDVGNGTTQNFGRNLNYLKNLWSAVQQQDYLRHKAAQVSIPVIDVRYNECNNLKCSSCGVVQANEKKPAKVITQLIKCIRNFKCGACGYEVNMLINQANNIVATNSVAKQHS